MRRTVRPMLVPLALLLAVAGCGGGPIQPPPVVQPPTVACPAPVSVTGVTGAAHAVSFPNPLVSGGAQPVTVTCTPASGSSFPVGQTQVTCVAGDSLGRQASCAFGVTVTALQLTATKFLAFGDSMTTGENGRPLSLEPFQPFIDEDNAYPTLLVSMLRGAFPTQEIVMANEGIGGKRVTDPEEEQRLTDALREHVPGAVLLLHGINDVKAETIPPHTIAAALGDMIRTARDRDVAFVFVSTLLPGKPGRREPPEDLVVATNAEIRKIAAGPGVYLIDPYAAFLAQRDAYIDEDGLHLTPAGNRALAEAFFERITAVMATSPGVLWAPGR